MATSKELKTRLRKFLDNPEANKDFRPWFASLLVDIHQENEAELDGLVQAIHLAFADAADGLYTASELAKVLTHLAGNDGAINQMIVVQPLATLHSVNQQTGGIEFQVGSGFSGTSPAVVFGSPQLLPT